MDNCFVLFSTARLRESLPFDVTPKANPKVALT